MKKLTVLFFLLLTQVTSAQDDFYNLNFNYDGDRLNFKWSNQMFSYFFIQTDSTVWMNEKHPVCINQFSFVWGDTIKAPLSATLFQSIFLPEITGRGECVLSIHNKCQNIPKVLMNVYALDKDGNTLSTHTLDINNQGEWKEYSLSITNPDIRFFYISISTNTPDSTGLWSGQKMWIDRIRLIVDGFDMANFNLGMLPLVPALCNDSIVPLSVANVDFNEMEDLKGKKIIALGESIHGVKEFNDLAAQLAKHQIVQNHCRLIVLEVSNHLILKWNLFVTGETSFGIEELEGDLSSILYSTPVWKEFIVWLKAYNTGRNRKVRLQGMNLNHSILDYLDYFYELALKNSVCKPLFTFAFEQNREKVLETLTSDPVFEQVLGSEEYSLLVQSLNATMYDETPSVFKWSQPHNSRDSIMFVHVKASVENCLRDKETALIYTHLGHSGRKNLKTYNLKPALGEYIHRWRGEDYLSIALLMGSGTVYYHRNKIGGSKDGSSKDGSRDGFRYWDLDSPAAYSVEEASKATGIPCFYGKTSLFSADVMMFRSNIRSFFAPLQGNFSSFIYVDKVNPIELKMKNEQKLFNNNHPKQVKRGKKLGIKKFEKY